VALIAGRPVGRAAHMRGRGCASCRETGFRGRIGVFELVVATDRLREALLHGTDGTALRRLAHEDGTTPLGVDGWHKAEAGITTIEEVLRVVQA
jgi:type II secretory ATPase GspE/PulE/Tfp pilus assembly ATPase PilB-like protein